MKAAKIRKTFLEYFEKKGHKIVPSSPIVNKNDPTLMFINAGMNQFKDYFLGNKKAKDKRVADTQKCLRVSGKHNDLEEVGRDGYHHTMFEMLGNWSFGDYFKEGAIDMAWELLTKELGLDPERMYASVFEGDVDSGLTQDDEAVAFWKKYLPEDRILFFDKKDNFWEMGETGPCGPCSEIHYDLRPAVDRAAISGKELVNMDHPQVIEIWNLVFIQFNRKADGALENLPSKHIDTGMGFERLCMVMQDKGSSYETDLFTPFIQYIESKTGKKYDNSYADDALKDIAFRVLVDHLRAVSFTIADGELPSNTGVGYVIRRILRRAVRYYYSFLDMQEPFLYSMVNLLVKEFGTVFPELKAQEDFITKVIMEEEKSFLRTLDAGLKRLDSLEIKGGVIDGKDAFELYDTYGFPIDLTRLIGSEKGFTVDDRAFEKALAEQKARSRADAVKKVGDWFMVNEIDGVQFEGYDHLELDNINITKYREVDTKKGKQYQIVLDKTPFYPEGGGQIGDTGFIKVGDEMIQILDTQKENDMILHYTDRLPEHPKSSVSASVAAQKRRLTENNHSATHLMHAALRDVLGDHVQQRGSLVTDKVLRFDFSHFQKVTDEEIAQVEQIVNQRIRQNIELKEDRSIPIQKAKDAGAMMLFGEKYGESVRMITFDKDYSIELCGGCHVPSTGKIGLFKITSESSVAAGVRRIEAVTAGVAEDFVKDEIDTLNTIRSLFKNATNIVGNVKQLQDDNTALKKQVEKLMAAQAGNMKGDLIKSAETINDINVIRQKVAIADTKAAKTLASQIEKELGNTLVVFGIERDGKAQIMITISQSLVEGKGLHAGNMVRELAKNINGGGGGQPFFATAGGSDPAGIESALKQVEELI